MRSLPAFLLLAGSVPGAAQVMPVPSDETPRVQTALFSSDQKIMLIALPETALTVMLEPGEMITRATLNGSSRWKITVSVEADTFQVAPSAGAEPAELAIETDRRSYAFALEASEGLMAAYLVRMTYDAQPAALVEAELAENRIEDLNWTYRLRGDHTVRPATIRDNGEKTVITYAPGQPLPAVFAIGATGDEEVVDGYMRGDAFVIDRVHSELVFRIDKEKATARRNAKEDARP